MESFRKRKFRLQSKFYIRTLQIMGMLGAGFLSSCTKYGAPEPIVEYGVPVNDVKFFGRIKSEDSLKNIPGLTVRLVQNQISGDLIWFDSIQTITNAQGEYILYHYAFKDDQFKLKVFDTDSAANVGDFKNTAVDITVSGRDENNLEHQADILLQKK